MLPPMLLRLRVQGDKRRIRLWIPLILLWPLIFPVVLLGTPIALLAARSKHRARSRSILLAGPSRLAARPALQRGLRRGPRIHFNRLGGCDD